MAAITAFLDTENDVRRLFWTLKMMSNFYFQNGLLEFLMVVLAEASLLLQSLS